MYDSLSDHVTREMFGADGEDEELAVMDAEETGKFKMKTPPWLLPAALGAAGGAGLTALGFTLFRKKKGKRSAASFAGVDPRTIDARKNDARQGVLVETVTEEMFGGGLQRSDLFGAALQRSDLFGSAELDDLEESFGSDDLDDLEESFGTVIPTWALLQGRERRIYRTSSRLQNLPVARLQRLLMRRGSTLAFRRLIKSELMRRQAPRY